MEKAKKIAHRPPSTRGSLAHLNAKVKLALHQTITALEGRKLPATGVDAATDSLLEPVEGKDWRSFLYVSPVVLAAPLRCRRKAFGVRRNGMPVPRVLG